MIQTTDRRTFLAMMASAPLFISEAAAGNGEGSRKSNRESYDLPSDLAAYAQLSVILGRASDRSITTSSLARTPMESFIEYGTAPGKYDRKTKPKMLVAGVPAEAVIENLQPNTEYFYRTHYRSAGSAIFSTRPECRFHTQRKAGSTFSFAIQGDSHPERPQMSDPILYARTLQMAAATRPDFYICMGDDFSVDKIRGTSAAELAEPYLLQRPFLGLIGQTAPIHLLNGNHEQASLFNFSQSDVRHDVAVGVQNARNGLYPTPNADNFYSGNPDAFKSIGPLKDYYAWTWGDALFVILDNYWHSPALVDSGYQEKGPAGGPGGGGGKKGGKGGGGGGGKNRDWWGISMGDAQYQWFKRTLEQSNAKFKFVFAHHVMGTGRGGVECSHLYEWGGKDKRGENAFHQYRPNWEMPVHDLMVKHGVTVFFQGHDHLYCQQERDGLIYQEVPMPADMGYSTYNEERYESGVKRPNSGYLNVTVSSSEVKVDYVRSFLPQDETKDKKTGDIGHSYVVSTRSRAFISPSKS